MPDNWMLLTLVALILIIAATLLHRQAHMLQRTFRQEVKRGLARTSSLARPVITADDLEPLPPLVRRYLERTGIVGRERTVSLRTVSRIDMDLGGGRGRAVMKAVEYNFFDSELTRTVLMEFKVKGLPMVGLDAYIRGCGRMQMRPFGLLPAVEASGDAKDASSAAVMLLLNMCIGAPATLIDPRLTWHETGPQQAAVTLTDGPLQVTGLLDFDAPGDLVRFTTEDKFYSPNGGTYERVRWTTPVLDYRDVGGLRLSTRGEATWQFESGDVVYGRLALEQINLNPAG